MAEAALKIIRNFYRDSVSLMQLSAQLGALPGVAQASVVMASANNLALLREAGLLLEAPVTAGPNDLLIAIRGEGRADLDAALAEAEALLHREPKRRASGEGGPRSEPLRSLAMGIEAQPGSTLALISAPGDYAAAEALKALKLGLNVMLFSDNVALADEIALKRLAREKRLLVMGPDCGTAIIDGVPLGFANQVRRGPIGLVAASGTGLQQVACLIDRAGQGISQAIGTGGRDLKEDVGGMTMLAGIAALAADSETKIIVLVSKPPSAAVMARILDAAHAAGKPVVVNFLGASIRDGGVHVARTLEEAAALAVALIEGRRPAVAEVTPLPAVGPFAPGQRWLRGLYSGGTFCYEASLLLGETLAPVHSNTPVGEADALEDAWLSRAHSLIDLGDDLFTRGRPHPMIDHRLRNERILREAEDPEVAVILLDIVLGYGAHPDPAGEMAPVIRAAKQSARQAGRALAMVGFVCGTAGDPQGLARQEAALAEAGMLLAQSNAQAVRLAGRLALAAAGAGQAALAAGGR
jgi:succinyl-CoA synthetase alpha subunit